MRVALGAGMLLMVLVACQPTVYLMPTPVALSAGAVDPFAADSESKKDTRVPVLYATNRVPVGAPEGRVYTIFADDAVHLGIAHLRIGEEGFDWRQLRAISTGETVERRPPLILDGLEEWAVVQKSDMKEVLSADARRFFDGVNQALSESQDKDLMVYVHGANAGIYRASAQAAQYRHFTGHNSVVLVFAWPSAESFLKYGTDVKHAAETVPIFAQFIEQLALHTNARSINILAYSAGSQVTSPALAQLRDSAGDEPVETVRRRLRLGEVYFAAPDANFQGFVSDLKRYVELSQNVTLAANLNDDVLAIAQMHHGVSRAGRPDLEELTEEETEWLLQASKDPRFDVIFVDPATIPDLGKGSHGFWYENPWVSTDVLIQFLAHARPAERGLVENEGEQGGRYWTFPPDYDTRIVELLRAAREDQ